MINKLNVPFMQLTAVPPVARQVQQRPADFNPAIAAQAMSGSQQFEMPSFSGAKATTGSFLQEAQGGLGDRAISTANGTLGKKLFLNA